VFLLFEQPADFDAKKWGTADGSEFPLSKRARYDFATFEKEAKLGPVVAANYFRSK
jgi:phosphatidylethanolamine-binding protein